MGNKRLFKLKEIRPGLGFNEAGGLAYKGTPKQALAQLACTSCLNNTLYTTAETQLNQILDFCTKIDPVTGQVLDAKYIAQVAIYSREKARMKDIPALLCAILATRREHALLRQVFHRVINNGDMLRKFIDMIRSGITGRHSFGSVPKRLITLWLNSRTPSELFDQSVGKPSMRDILRMVHPRPMDKTRSALYGWFVGKNFNTGMLPQCVQDYEVYKTGQTTELPDLPYEMLTCRPLGAKEYKTIAERAGWQWLRKNLNNLVQYGVFSHFPEMGEYIANRLSDRKTIQKIHAFPYQILTSYKYSEDIPPVVREALHDAMEIATENTPVLPMGEKGAPSAYVLLDVSGSMKNPITGVRYGSTSKMSRADVASLIACCILRKNPDAVLLPFNKEVVAFHIDRNETIMQNSLNLAAIANGGTACSAAMRHLNAQNAVGDVVYIISDDQSWVESIGIDRWGNKLPGETALMAEWKIYKNRNPNARMVCVDIAPYVTRQTQEREDILNIGGFSDSVFELMNSFCSGALGIEHWVGEIEKIDLEK